MANQFNSDATKAKGDWISIGFTPLGILKAAISLSKDTAAGQVTTSAATRLPPEPTSDWASYDLDTGARTDLANPSGIELIKNAFQSAADSVKAAAAAVGNAASAAATAIMNPVETFNGFMKTKVDGLGKTVAATMANQNAAGPMAGLVNLGLTVSGWATSTLGAYFLIVGALAVATALYPGFTIAAAAVGSLSTLLIAICIPLIFFGVRLAAVIPFIPSIMWAGAILNWLVIVVEAMFGAPLWAMVHLDLEGEGLTTSRTAHGYMFILNLLFRPIILVGLFYFSQALMNGVFGLFLGAIAGFISNLASDGASWWADLMVIIGAIWVVVAFAETVISRSMGVLLSAPDQILGWVGGHFNPVGAGANFDQVIGNSGANSAREAVGKLAGSDRKVKAPMRNSESESQKTQAAAKN